MCSVAYQTPAAVACSFGVAVVPPERIDSPEPTDHEVPNQGKLGVFLAKEVLRLHQGEIHAGPGMDGMEILISLRSL